MRYIKSITIGIASLLLLLFIQPAIADSVQETKATLYYMPWMRSDGTEINGTKTVNESDNIIKDTWYASYKKQGVYYSAFVDQIYGISTNENISISPFVGDVYYTSATFEGVENFSNVTYKLSLDKTIPILTFFWELSPNKAMTGCEQLYYRSPLVWNDSDNIYIGHFLNIFDESGNLVWASSTLGDPYADISKYINDGSEYNSTGGQRVYYKIDANFRTNVRYRFSEYVTTLFDTPVNQIKLYMSPTQDIGDDGYTDTFCFLGTPNARKVPFEASWSAIATIGIGVSGTETIIYSDSDFDNISYSEIQEVGLGNQPLIVSQMLYGTMANVGSIEVILPLRTSMPLNVSIYYKIWSGNSEALRFGVALEKVTGTIHTRFNIIDPNAALVNNYTLEFRITNFGLDGEAMSYYMYPKNNSAHLVWNEDAVGSAGGGHLDFKHFAMHVEVNEYLAAGTADTSAKSALSIWDYIAIAIGIFIIVAAVTFDILTGGLTTPAILVAVSVGTGFIALGLSGQTEEVMSSVISGTSSILLSVGNAVWAIAGALWAAAVWVVETLIHLGELILEYGALIAEAIWQIIWLLAFIVVVWVWLKFLNIMKYITQGDPDKALKEITTVEGAATKQIYGRSKRGYNYLRPVQKYNKKGENVTTKQRQWRWYKGGRK